MKHYVGIDNANLTHSVCIIDQSGKVIKNFEISNNDTGYKRLKLNIEKFPNPVIAFELPHGPLIDFLRKLPYKQYSLNPLKVKRFKQTFSVSGNKSDKVDSEAIAQYIKFNEKTSREMLFNSPEIETLKQFGVSHDRLVRDHTRYSNRLLFLFRQYFPLYSGLFSETAPKTLLKMVLKYPIWEKLKNETTESFESFLRSNKYSNPKYVKRLRDKIDSYAHHVMPEVEISMQYEAMAIANILLSIKDQLANIENEMWKIVEVHKDGKILSSLPGAGKVLTSKILGIIGDNRKRFTKANQVQCLFGTAPMNYQSGGYHKVIMRKACNKRAKSILFSFAFSSLRFSPWARAYYDGQRKKGKNHSLAVRALSNKWINIIFAMWKNKQEYVEKINNLVAA